MVRGILIGMVLLVVSSLMCGCGVAQEEYDKVTSDLSAAQGQIKTLQSDLSAAQGQIKTVESELSAAQAQIKTLESNYEKAQSDLSTAQSQIKTLQGDYDDQKAKIAKATAYATAFHIYLYPIRKEAGIAQKLHFASEAEWLVALTNSIKATGDDVLQSDLRTMMKGGPEGEAAGIRFLHNTVIMVLRSLD